MINYVLNFAVFSFSMYKIKEFMRKSFFILLESLDLTLFLIENARYVVSVETKRVNTSITSP
jgi:hypothetical protein